MNRKLKVSVISLFSFILTTLGGGVTGNRLTSLYTTTNDVAILIGPESLRTAYEQYISCLYASTTNANSYVTVVYGNTNMLTVAASQYGTTGIVTVASTNGFPINTPIAIQHFNSSRTMLYTTITNATSSGFYISPVDTPIESGSSIWKMTETNAIYYLPSYYDGSTTLCNPLNLNDAITFKTIPIRVVLSTTNGYLNLTVR